MKPLLLLTFALALGCAGGDKPTDDDDFEVTDDTAGEDTEDTEDTEDPGPTTGPGVLGDETGLEAMCRRYVECGGSYYADAEACIQASYDYWGECTSAKDALNALGECVANVECGEYNPDSYTPSSVGCGDEWSDLGAADC
ncbi:MAG: hypothetical protein Q8P41_04825 [Pseudomonadota bacterium]|nr:hypothetical protein [Pseudomonadota bacterium]